MLDLGRGEHGGKKQKKMMLKVDIRAFQSCHLFDTYFLLNKFILSN